MPLAYMNAYPPTISCKDASLTCRSRWSEGAATFTTQMSKPAMNIASTTTGSISQRRDAVSIEETPSDSGVRWLSKFDVFRMYDRRRTHRKRWPMLESVMDDVVEPAADDM